MYTDDCLQGCRPGVSAIDRRHGCRVVDNDLDDDDADFVSRKYFLSHFHIFVPVVKGGWLVAFESVLSCISKIPSSCV